MYTLFKNTLLKQVNLLVIVLKFSAVGAVGFIINYSLLRYFVGQYSIDKILAEILATIFALQATFLLNNYWTYRSPKHDESFSLSFSARYVAYITSNSAGAVITIVFFAIAHQFIPLDFIALLIGAFFGTMWNFLLNLLFVWRERNESRVQKGEQG